MNGGYVGWCWMLKPKAGQPDDAWHNGATGAGWTFIGASSTCAVAACVSARLRAAFDTATWQALD